MPPDLYLLRPSSRRWLICDRAARPALGADLRWQTSASSDLRSPTRPHAPEPDLGVALCPIQFGGRTTGDTPVTGALAGSLTSPGDVADGDRSAACRPKEVSALASSLWCKGVPILRRSLVVGSPCEGRSGAPCARQASRSRLRRALAKMSSPGGAHGCCSTRTACGCKSRRISVMFRRRNHTRAVIPIPLQR